MRSDSIVEVFANLTDRQREVLDLACTHMTSKQIALELDISAKTVDRRIEAVRAKLDNVPRSDLLRLYSVFGHDGVNSPEHIFPLHQSRSGEQVPARQSEVILSFRDSASPNARMDWHHDPRRQKIEIKLAELGPGTRIVLMLVGAVALMAVAVLTFTASTALQFLLEK